MVEKPLLHFIPIILAHFYGVVINSGYLLLFTVLNSSLLFSHHRPF